MKKLDRYMLRLLLEAFGFFVLIFTGVIWLTQAVRLIDTVIASGQSAATFLEFSALVLPQVFVIVFPLSGIGATLYTLNRLYMDSELTVMMASGFGPTALLRPIVMFGGLIGAAMAVVTMFLVPLAGTALADRTRSIRSDLANALIVERQFIHPISGLTLFITDTNRAGEMSGLFLNDQRDPEQTVTYSAEQALLLRDEEQARLVMIDGVALSSGRSGKQMNSVSFDQFVFDLTELVAADDTRIRRPSEYSVSALLNPTPEMLAEKYRLGDYLSEGHYKITMPLLSVIFPLIALATFLAGGYRRSGFGRRVVVAVAVSVVAQVILFTTKGSVQSKPGLWPGMYAAHVLGLIYVTALLLWLGRTRKRPVGVPA